MTSSSQDSLSPPGPSFAGPFTTVLDSLESLTPTTNSNELHPQSSSSSGTESFPSAEEASESVAIDPHWAGWMPPKDYVYERKTSRHDRDSISTTRSPNAFMLFRSWIIQKKLHDVDESQPDISRIAGNVWKSLPKVVLDAWHNHALRIKRQQGLSSPILKEDRQRSPNKKAKRRVSTSSSSGSGSSSLPRLPTKALGTPPFGGLVDFDVGRASSLDFRLGSSLTSVSPVAIDAAGSATPPDPPFLDPLLSNESPPRCPAPLSFLADILPALDPGQVLPDPGGLDVMPWTTSSSTLDGARLQPELVAVDCFTRLLEIAECSDLFPQTVELYGQYLLKLSNSFM